MSDIISEREPLIFYPKHAVEAERKLHEARISAQAAEIERLRDDLAKAMESLGRSKYWTATMSQAAIKAINESMLEKRRADDAEAKLAKAVEALGCWNRMMNNPAYDMGEMVSEFDAIARTTLAELTGGKDG